MKHARPDDNPADQPDISADGVLAWHAQILRPVRREAEFGLSVFECVPDPEPQPEPEVLVESDPEPVEFVPLTWRQRFMEWLRRP